MAGTSSRIEEARARAAGAKRSLGAAAAVGFVTALFLAYVSHPGATPTTVSGENSDDTSGVIEDDDLTTSGFAFGQGTIAPSSGSVPQVQTHVS